MPQKLIVINFPHNPTGSTISLDQLNRIIELAKKHSITIFSDEMYRLLEHDTSRRLPAAADLYKHAISLSGMSKTFALPGLRIGWLASQSKTFLDAALAFKDYTTICSSAPSQVLAVMGLRAQEHLLKRNTSIIQQSSEATQAFISKYSEMFSWYPPQSGSIDFIRYAGSEGVAALSERLIEKEGIMILPSTVFDYGDHHWRIGLGRKHVPEVLERLDKYFESA